ncbi:lasso peptide biosynthesis B2 protein [Allosphingosinicella deserti]|uniref:Microcin J25-processing protein McjB C-terminal domain-containing protein n=1 Tax=Allosphingosinicella deserti TaxID=2116704 RepID=A0A2P7QW39_9SPHN|nr:lasso peptide biosynthesis B2 protein [Sphingomonas deserti]PSJ42173.1 hypothetical protein C7I55_08025 [Sphingomonas deserti]
MGYVLRTGISFCDVGGRLLFLDTIADRYFCLGLDGEAAFRSLIVRRAPAQGEGAALAGLLRSGLLVETGSDQVPCPFLPPDPPTGSLLDEAGARIRIRDVAAATAALALARRSLRRRGLHATLCRLAERKSEADEVSVRRLGGMVAAFEYTARLARSHDQCLIRSIAAAQLFRRRNLPADLIIGVRLRPFAAHAWVQTGPWLVNDRVDTVNTYTPVLSL